LLVPTGRMDMNTYIKKRKLYYTIKHWNITITVSIIVFGETLIREETVQTSLFINCRVHEVL